MATPNPEAPASGAPASAAEPESTAPPSPEPPSGGTTLDSLRSLPPPPQATPTAMAAATAAGPTHRQPERMPCLPPPPASEQGPCQRARAEGGKDLGNSVLTGGYEPGGPR